MLTFEESQTLLNGLAVPIRTETVPLNDAFGRVLATDVRLDRDQPGFDRATMDGYAVCLAEGRTDFAVVGTVTAGTVFEGTLEPGQAVRIMTGAPAPEGVTVVPIERTDGGQEAEGRVRIEDAALEPGRNIAWRGEDGHAGDVVVSAGTRLSAATLSSAAMAGETELDCHVAPTVALVTTGDEVGAAGEAGIRDSNGPLLEALCRAAGSPLTRCHARDDEGELERVLREATENAQIVVTTGGVSMGSRDLIPDTIAALGYETVFHKVAIQPGKPVLLARHGSGTLFLGLPGNPVSVLATAHLYLLPALQRCAGVTSAEGDASRGWLELPLATDFESRARRHLFLPARLESGGIVPVRWNGSGDLLAAANADGLVDIPIGSSRRAGELARFLPYFGHVLGERGVLPPRATRR